MLQSALIVDDHLAVRLVIRRHLGTLGLPGLRIVEAATAAEATAAFPAEEFDLTFLDGVFGDGTPALEVLTSMLAHRPDGCIVLTSSRPREHPDIVEALGIGAFAYLAKPVQRQDVHKLVTRMDHEEGNIIRLR